MATSNVNVSPSAEIALVKEYPPLPFVSTEDLFDTIEEHQIQQVEENLENCLNIGLLGILPLARKAIQPL